MCVLQECVFHGKCPDRLGSQLNKSIEQANWTRQLDESIEANWVNLCSTVYQLSLPNSLDAWQPASSTHYRFMNSLKPTEFCGKCFAHISHRNLLGDTSFCRNFLPSTVYEERKSEQYTARSCEPFDCSMKLHNMESIYNSVYEVKRNPMGILMSHKFCVLIWRDLP